MPLKCIALPFGHPERQEIHCREDVNHALSGDARAGKAVHIGVNSLYEWTVLLCDAGPAVDSCQDSGRRRPGAVMKFVRAIEILHLCKHTF
jgi:hypothetical protein